MKITDFYNHNNFKKSVQAGDKIINNTNFSKYEFDRLQAIKNFKIGDIIKDNGKLAKITDIKQDTIIATPLNWFTSTGKLKKAYKNNGGQFFNPCHVQLIR